MNKRMLPAVTLAAGFAVGTPAVATAATAPKSFVASGVLENRIEGERDEQKIVLSFHQGSLRVEATGKDGGQTVFVVRKGDRDIAMLDPAQKVVVRLTAAAMKQPGTPTGLGFDQLLDPEGFRRTLMKEGRKVGPGERLAGEATTVWTRAVKDGTARIWLSDRLQLPLRVDGTSGKDGFRLDIRRIDLTPKFTSDTFNPHPRGYQELKGD
ncbi:MAG: hypothetical protein VKO21_06655 [Candidatus Sericytochromatia bacterium]|nr:hypothetical protein [Candidatus Sericytochromatia bacterium]